MNTNVNTTINGYRLHISLWIPAICAGFFLDLMFINVDTIRSSDY